MSTIKQSLVKIIKKSLITFTELQICLLEISAYINNRPIGFLSSDPKDDIQAISPSLLTIGREIEPLDNYDGTLPDLTIMYNNRSTMIKEFLLNWKANYLNDLSPTKKWLKNNPYKLKEGMILLIKDENRMKDLWQKGRITKIIRSKNDAIARTVELKTLKGTLIRPIQKCALPESLITEEDESDTSNQHITNIAIPEINDQEELKVLVSLGQKY